MAEMCVVRRLGLVEFADGQSLQSQLAAARKADAIPDSLLLLEHPHVLTVGRTVSHLPGGLDKQLLVSQPELAARGVAVYDVDRGGAVTYHGPGQLIAYPILKLKGKRRDVHRYLRDLEEAAIRTLRDFQIESARIPGFSGVWVNGDKIASIGVHLSRWVTTHGLALNVTTDLSFFNLIHPCGLTNIRMTSVESILGQKVTVQEVADRFITHFSSIFETTVIEQGVDSESVQVIIRSQKDDAYLLLRRTSSSGGFWQPVTGFIAHGESAIEAACREVGEETGLQLSATNAHTRRLVDLGYVHAFALTYPLRHAAVEEPTFVREHSFALLLEERTPQIKLNPAEHDDYCFVDHTTAAEVVPWEGTKRAIRLTEQIAHLAC